MKVYIHRCIRHRNPTYFGDYCVPASEVPRRQQLRSAKTSSFHVIAAACLEATCAFSVAGPTFWSSLHDDLRDPAVGSEHFGQDLNAPIHWTRSVGALHYRALQIDIYST